MSKVQSESVQLEALPGSILGDIVSFIALYSVMHVLKQNVTLKLKVCVFVQLKWFIYKCVLLAIDYCLCHDRYNYS